MKTTVEDGVVRAKNQIRAGEFIVAIVGGHLTRRVPRMHHEVRRALSIYM